MDVREINGAWLVASAYGFDWETFTENKEKFVSLINGVFNAAEESWCKVKNDN